MKELKKLAAKDHKKILEDDTFFEDELLKHYDNQKKQKRIRLAAMIGTPCLAVMIAVIGIILGYLLAPEPEIPYLDYTEKIQSGLTTVNQSLSKTQLNGDYDLITLLYNTQTLKKHYFTVSTDFVTAEAMGNLSMVLLVDRDYPYATELIEYSDTFELAGYIVEFEETMTETTWEDIPINDFTVTAVFDTGNEIYFIDYHEISLNEQSGFKNFMQTTIFKK